MPNLIVFSGLDGAGKSTQIDALRQRLDQIGKRSATIWSRGGYTPGMEFAKALVRRLSGKRVLPASGASASRSKQLSVGWKRRLWLRLAMLDLTLLYAVWYRMMSLAGRVVLADRYLDDTLLDFRLNFPQESVEKWWQWKILVALAPSPKCSFLLTVPVEVSEQRSMEKNEPFPTPADQLQARSETYLRWREDRERWHWLDGTRSVDAISAEIWGRVEKAIGVQRKHPKHTNAQAAQ